jgi:hypothetical protein
MRIFSVLTTSPRSVRTGADRMPIYAARCMAFGPCNPGTKEQAIHASLGAELTRL